MGVIVPGMPVVVLVVVVVAAAGQLQGGKAKARGDQDPTHDRVLSALDRRAKLESDGDDHAAEHDRHQDVGHPGQT